MHSRRRYKQSPNIRKVSKSRRFVLHFFIFKGSGCCWCLGSLFCCSFSVTSIVFTPLAPFFTLFAVLMCNPCCWIPGNFDLRSNSLIWLIPSPFTWWLGGGVVGMSWVFIFSVVLLRLQRFQKSGLMPGRFGGIVFISWISGSVVESTWFLFISWIPGCLVASTPCLVFKWVPGCVSLLLYWLCIDWMSECTLPSLLCINLFENTDCPTFVHWSRDYRDLVVLALD